MEARPRPRTALRLTRDGASPSSRQLAEEALVAPDAPEGFIFIVARRMRSPVLLGQRARSVEVQASEADTGPETYVALLRKLMTASLRRPRGSPAVTDTPAAARPSSPMDGPTPISYSADGRLRGAAA